MATTIFFRTFAAAFTKGEVLEWLKRHAWKACKPLKGFMSSNLILSAIRSDNQIYNYYRD